jgi:hypothetical protein
MNMKRKSTNRLKWRRSLVIGDSPERRFERQGYTVLAQPGAGVPGRFRTVCCGGQVVLVGKLRILSEDLILGCA